MKFLFFWLLILFPYKPFSWILSNLPFHSFFMYNIVALVWPCTLHNCTLPYTLHNCTLPYTFFAQLLPWTLHNCYHCTLHNCYNVLNVLFTIVTMYFAQLFTCTFTIITIVLCMTVTIYFAQLLPFTLQNCYHVFWTIVTMYFAQLLSFTFFVQLLPSTLRIYYHSLWKIVILYFEQLLPCTFTIITIVRISIVTDYAQFLPCSAQLLPFTLHNFIM